MKRGSVLAALSAAATFGVQLTASEPAWAQAATGTAAATTDAPTREAETTPRATEPETLSAPTGTTMGPRFSDFMDTRLTWTFGDDDVLTPTGERVPVSPLPSIGDRQQYQLFFDALNTRYAGRENLTHLTIYSRAPGFIPRVVTEAALVVRLDLAQLATGSNNLNQAIYDAGTYLRLQYQTNLARPQDGVSLTFFPFDTDRFRLGYLWDLSWGGNDIFPRRVGSAPGVRLAIDSGPFSAYVGLKSAYIVVPLSVAPMSQDIEEVRVQETQYGGLAGVGYRVSDMLRFDVSGGYFQQGRFDFPGVRGQQVYAFGGSARVVVNNNLPASTSIDMLLYRNHPDFPMQLFAQETYTPGEVRWMVSAEFTAMDQNLADIDHPGRTALQTGLAGAIQGRMKLGYLGLGLTGLYRDVPFLLRNVPSFIPFQTLPSDPTAHVSPEFFGAFQLDYRIASLNLLPAIIVGVQAPATFSSEVTEGGLSSQRTLVIRRNGNFSILPPGQGATPIINARASLRWDLSSIFAVIGWVQYVYDFNGTLLFVDQTGTRQERYFQYPHQLGFGMSAQARF
jgi:hypothetical protein